LAGRYWKEGRNGREEDGGGEGGRVSNGRRGRRDRRGSSCALEVVIPRTRAALLHWNIALTRSKLKTCFEQLLHVYSEVNGDKTLIVTQTL